MNTDIRVIDADLYFLPADMRMPLKFGDQVLTQVTCARVRVRVQGSDGRSAEGWGETPLSVGWVWPCAMTFQEREDVLKAFCKTITRSLRDFDAVGHPIEIGSAFTSEALASLLADHNANVPTEKAMPHLASLVCFSPFDIAVHDAYGNLHGVPTYETYGAAHMNHDLGSYLEPADAGVSFSGLYPADFLTPREDQLPVWHLVGGLDPLTADDLTGDEPDDGYPVLLEDWIDTDGLNCLKIKLRGTDSAWDYERLVRIGEISLRKGVQHLTADFNCTVSDPAYVDAILDELKTDHRDISDRILYVEQPFPYDLEANQIDVHSTSSRKLLLMDESAHDWRLIKLGYGLGWTGVALKTCKTQTGALLSLCWAKAHGMALMVQDLTNPMLAQIPHVLLAAHAGTIMGVESNAMQFYPEASLPDMQVHPGLHVRRNGVLDLSSLRGSGFGYLNEEIPRQLPIAESV